MSIGVDIGGTQCRKSHPWSAHHASAAHTNFHRCRDGCGRGCNVTISSREDKLQRLTPRDNNDVNSSWMCDEGRLDFHYVNSEARLTEPLLTEGRSHRIAAWPW